jgi:hypothetical protein
MRQLVRRQFTGKTGGIPPPEPLCGAARSGLSIFCAFWRAVFFCAVFSAACGFSLFLPEPSPPYRLHCLLTGPFVNGPKAYYNTGAKTKKGHFGKKGFALRKSLIDSRCN